jgi:hypothetical protein
VFSVGTLIMAWDFLVKLRMPRGDVGEPNSRTAAVAAE